MFDIFTLCVLCTGTLNRLETSQVTPRVRSFAHVDGNYALHVYIPGNYLFIVA